MSSGYKGVTWNKGNKKWDARITVPGGSRMRLGEYADKKEAAKAWDAAARLQNRTEVNFPRPGTDETKALVRAAPRSPAEIAAAKAKGGGSSKYVGVSWVKFGKWKAESQSRPKLPRGGR